MQKRKRERIKIVGGKFRGKQIEVPPGTTVRPTLNKTRESVFNVLQNLVFLPEMTVVDLFAGSGALGLEALSRGAQSAVFVENSPPVFPILLKNINAFLFPPEQVWAVYDSARKWLPHFSPALTPCLFFIDPPYQSSEYNPILALISELVVIPKQSLLVVEAPRSLEYSLANNMERLKTKHYGQTKLDFLVKC